MSKKKKRVQFSLLTLLVGFVALNIGWGINNSIKEKEIDELKNKHKQEIQQLKQDHTPRYVSITETERFPITRKMVNWAFPQIEREATLHYQDGRTIQLESESIINIYNHPSFGTLGPIQVPPYVIWDDSRDNTSLYNPIELPDYSFASE